MSDAKVNVSGPGEGCLSSVLGLLVLWLALWAVFEKVEYRQHCRDYPGAWICAPIYGGDVPKDTK
jgi:hypothetical protein